MPADPGDVRNALVEGVEGALRGQGEIPTRWVLIAESVGDDGVRGLYWATSDGMKAWETLGLLDYGVQQERATIVAAELRKGD